MSIHLPETPAAATGVPLDDEIRLHLEVQRLYTLEARLLDQHRYADWLELLADDLHYWAPVRSNRLRRQQSLADGAPGEVVLTWSPASDNHGVSGYRVFRNGTALGTVTGTTYTDSTLKEGQSASYTVSAFDEDGNESAQSTAVTGHGGEASGRLLDGRDRRMARGAQDHRHVSVSVPRTSGRAPWRRPAPLRARPRTPPRRSCLAAPPRLRGPRRAVPRPRTSP